MIFEEKFLLALGATSVIEAPVVLFLSWIFKIKNWRKIIVTAFLVSVITLPYLWFILPPFVDARLYPWIGEGLVIVVEAVLYWYFLKAGACKSCLISLIANTVSYFLGGFIL